jgi:putative SOS response-associated peptidase YedK
MKSLQDSNFLNCRPPQQLAVGNIRPLVGKLSSRAVLALVGSAACKRQFLAAFRSAESRTVYRGMPPPPKFGGPPVTNIRNTSSPRWRGWLKPENRCLVPFNSFSEYAPEPNPETKKKDVVWFALDDDRPLTAFAGIWTEFRGDRGTRRLESLTDLVLLAHGPKKVSLAALICMTANTPGKYGFRNSRVNWYWRGCHTEV